MPAQVPHSETHKVVARLLVKCYSLITMDAIVNDFSQLDAQQEESRLAQVGAFEQDPREFDAWLDAAYEARTELPE